MDKTILTLDQHNMDPSADTSDRDNYYERHAARAVLSDSAGQIALVYAGHRGYYKLPGGGIDDGEDIAVALARELMEETGSVAKVSGELGQVVEWRDYEKMKQVSYAFKASLVGEPGQPNFTDSELAEEFKIVWADDLATAIELVESQVAHEDIAVRFMATRDAAILRAAK